MFQTEASEGYWIIVCSQACLLYLRWYPYMHNLPLYHSTGFPGRPGTCVHICIMPPPESSKSLLLIYVKTPCSAIAAQPHMFCQPNNTLCRGARRCLMHLSTARTQAACDIDCLWCTITTWQHTRVLGLTRRGVTRVKPEHGFLYVLVLEVRRPGILFVGPIIPVGVGVAKEVHPLLLSRANILCEQGSSVI